MTSNEAVSTIMSAPVVTVDPDTAVDSAARILTRHSIGSLVVGDERIDGIVTETDIVGSVAKGLDLSDTPVSDLMSTPVVTVRPTDTISDAGQRMGANNVKKLPVTEEGRAVGIVTTTDLAHHVPRQSVRMASRLEPDIDKGEFE